MFIPVTVIATSIIATVFIFLSFRVINARSTSKVSLGDGGDETLQRRIRGHGNLAEYGPFGLILILAAELQAAPLWILVICVAVFMLGRLMHAYAFGFTDENVKGRVGGMILTFTGLSFLIVLNLYALIF